MIKFNVEGKAFTKQYIIGRGKIRCSKNTHDFEWFVGQRAKEFMRKHNLPPLKGAIELQITVFVFSKIKHDTLFCTKKPDCTNILKSVEDGLKNICFEDDKNVVNINISKFWCYTKKDERIEICIKNEPLLY